MKIFNHDRHNEYASDVIQRIKFDLTLILKLKVKVTKLICLFRDDLQRKKDIKRTKPSSQPYYLSAKQLDRSISLRGVHKRRPQSKGRRSLFSTDIFRTRGERSLQLRTSALFGRKNSDISKFLVCPHGQGGRGGKLFAILCGYLLWTFLYTAV